MVAFATTKVEVRSDSQLVVNQIQRKYEARDERMTCYLTLMDAQTQKLERWTI